jgi:hypothetical protein
MRRSAIERLLPAAYQQAAGPGTVLAALLAVMEGLHEPSERVLAAAPELFSPYRTRPDLVPFLAGWVAADHLRLPPVPVGRLRDLVATGLRAVLETATGVPGFAVEEPADRPFHIVVRAPAAARPQLQLVRHIVEIEKPAAVTCEVTVPAGDPQESAEKGQT